MPRRSLHALVIVLTLAALGLAACGDKNKDKKKKETQTSIQLNWIDDHAWSGFYFAESKDYYADNGLRVDLRLALDAEGNYVSPIDEVSAGYADFGVAEAVEVLMARAEGKPVVAIATIYQRHPFALVSLAEKGIVRPHDLIGATIEITGSNVILYQTLLSALEISANNVNTVERTDYSLQPLLSGEADVIDGWVTNEVVALELGGYDFNMILASDYGVETYPNVIFTSEDMINNKPEIVERFLQATLKGYQDAVDDPQKAAQLAIARDPTLDPASQTEGMRRSVPLIVPAGSKIGLMTPDVWQMSLSMLRDQGLLSAPLDVSRAYTLEFLNQIYQ